MSVKRIILMLSFVSFVSCVVFYSFNKSKDNVSESQKIMFLHEENIDRLAESKEVYSVSSKQNMGLLRAASVVSVLPSSVDEEVEGITSLDWSDAGVNMGHSGEIFVLEDRNHMQVNDMDRDLIKALSSLEVPRGSTDWEMLLEQNFAVEDRDYEWAYRHEQSYIDFFSEQEPLAEFALIETECKSKYCRLSIGVSDVDQAGRAFQGITQAFDAMDKPLSIFLANSGEFGTLVFYVRPLD